ncbi:hypothetical protein PROFUN_01006 [Planoprotostelium fungivorum]|uniref:Uncharacterized protein n=1 Tax=Planoprotostelium fungivorum TaxID=1890364 RepID=A0A2P6N4G8_9EUKA|nr:hypothetical protein PROFUN_01006 [Planoprotostelium fungivorum]
MLPSNDRWQHQDAWCKVLFGSINFGRSSSDAPRVSHVQATLKHARWAWLTCSRPDLMELWLGRILDRRRPLYRSPTQILITTVNEEGEHRIRVVQAQIRKQEQLQVLIILMDRSTKSTNYATSFIHVSS